MTVAMDCSKKVLGVGAPIVDLLCHVDEDFIKQIPGDKGGMVMVSAAELNALLKMLKTPPEIAPGGSAGNTVFALSRLGVKSALLGKLGLDEDGRYYEDALKSVGGGSQAFSYTMKEPTSRCLSLVTPDSERTMRSNLAASSQLSANDITPGMFKDVDLVHVEGYFLFCNGLIERVLELAKTAGCKVSFDLASFEVVKAFNDTLPDLLKKYVDIVFANEDESAAFCGKIPLERQLEKLNELCEIAVVKLGRNGSSVKRVNEPMIKVPAKIVPAIDSTGAGDLWQGGFLYGFINGLPLSRCAELGSIMGAEVVQVMGAQIPEHRYLAIADEFKI